MAPPSLAQSRHAATSHHLQLPSPNADPQAPQPEAQSPPRSRRTLITNAPRRKTRTDDGVQASQPPRKPIHQTIKHEYTPHPPPQTGFLTLTYGAKIKDDLVRILGSNFIRGQRDWREPVTELQSTVNEEGWVTVDITTQNIDGQNNPIVKADDNPPSPTKDSAIDIATPIGLQQEIHTPSLFIASRSSPVPGVGVTTMAPVSVSGPDPGTRIHASLKEVIQDLYDIQSMVHGYAGSDTHPHLVDKVIDLTHSLAEVQSDARSTSLPSIPPELIDYVDEGRNPDIYTREFVELVQRGNAVVNGKKRAFAGFSEVFARRLVEEQHERRRRATSGGGTKGDIEGTGYVVDLEREAGRVMRHAGLDAKGSGSEIGDRGESGRNGDIRVKAEGVKEEAEENWGRM